MTEQELRVLVRNAISRQRASETALPARPDPGVLLHAHASHGLFVLPVGADTDGPCVIEPAVTCNHCGYCKSMGH